MKTAMAMRMVGLMVAMGAGTAAVAQHQTFHIEPRESLVQFLFDGSKPHVEGTFRVADTDILFDKNGPKMGGSLIVKAGSERSGDRARDKALHAQELAADQFQDIVFEPKSFTGKIDVSDGKSVIQVTGTLTLRGVPHAVTVPVEFASTGNRATVHVHLTVPYVQWGLKDLTGLHIQAGPEVQIDVNLVGYLTPEN
jgi:polyisoprenoid-binding protein YceI